MRSGNIILFSGETKKIDLPECFSAEIRTDLIQEVWRIQRTNQPYGAFVLAGKQDVARGKFRHRRHKWKTLYGLGVARGAKKMMSRRGERFYWRGAFNSGTVGGREAHPPKTVPGRIKINKKIRELALRSSVAATASAEFIEKKYGEKFGREMPLIMSSDILSKKPKEIAGFIEKLLKISLLKKKKIRAGKGKARGRKYKSVSKILLITSSKENAAKMNCFGLETLKTNHLNVPVLSPGGTPGRIAIWTEKAVEEMKK